MATLQHCTVHTYLIASYDYCLQCHNWTVNDWHLSADAQTEMIVSDLHALSHGIGPFSRCLNAVDSAVILNACHPDTCHAKQSIQWRQHNTN